MNKMKMFRTDLALDEFENLENNDNSYQHQKEYNGIDVYELFVNDELSKKINKKKGLYYTIDLSKNNYHNYSESEKIEDVVSNVLKEVIIKHHLEKKRCLVIGLGNDNVTPDALGPYALDHIIVTRHLFLENIVNKNYSEVSGITPGVMGNTGIETFDIIKSIINNVEIDYLIVVDALASSSIKRINNTIQITDTGISPGSGVGNKRKEVSFETLGLPVIAIGVPTVVDYATITHEVIKLVINYLSSKIDQKNKIKESTQDMKNLFLGEIGKLSDEEQSNLINQAITEKGYNLMVTPKDVDMEIEDLSKIIAMSINKALHFQV